MSLLSDAPAPELLQALLAPLSDEAPCGVSLRYEPDFDRLREMRREDDTSLPTGVWKAEVKRSDWAAVERLASDLLKTRSKDLMVAAWLGEAWLHRQVPDALPRALGLVAGLCERYPETLHPQAEDGDQSWRVTPLDWLARTYATVLHTRVPLFDDEGGDFATFTLHDWQQLQHQQVVGADSKAAKAAAEVAHLRQQKLNERVREVPIAVWLRKKGSLEASEQNLQRLDQWSDAWLGDIGPSYSPLREVIAALATLVQGFIDAHPQRPSPQPAEPLPTTVEARQTDNEEVEGNRTVDAQNLSNRDDAYRQLELIADYLARTEPHSPVPYLIRRAVEWGNKPLNELLNELISADAEARRVWSLLGVLK
ncbi:type VI secretion system protein TssA [Pseudomonas sp. GD03944]|uniref:type VI secretion system protein TssA n=1 Tax=Pseudomonas sp. GD03944 TaxID=2975409 RepID=UPI00244B300B|nr:type VI secretion system protein TssA [Pseudomonas sp. GD03944]MDH1263693.1 type VI secretion system protein TssA [Pseudomonas sp. GD03944]